MNKKFEKLGFYPADILLPKDCDMEKWAVVACDQFTSEPEYWEAVEKKVGDAPSTRRVILPEANLEDPNVDEYIADITACMDKYMADGIFETLKDSLIYIPTGLLGAILGTYILKKISPKWLKRIFGIIMVYAGLRLLLK